MCEVFTAYRQTDPNPARHPVSISLLVMRVSISITLLFNSLVPVDGPFRVIAKWPFSSTATSHPEPPSTFAAKVEALQNTAVLAASPERTLVNSGCSA